MGEERMKVLAMLAEGKVSVDEAVRLLEAIGQAAPAPSMASGPGPENDDLAQEMERLQGEVRERIGRARETLRATIPQAAARLRSGMPDLEKTIGEAVGAIPDVGAIVREALRGVAEATSEWAGHDDRRRGREEAARAVSLSAPFEPGTRLHVTVPRGDLRLETWDREGVGVEGRVVGFGRTLERAQEKADSVAVSIEEVQGGLHVLAQGPEENRDDGWRVDLTVRLPENASLEVDAAHGLLATAAVSGEVKVTHRHGNARIGGAGRDLQIHHAHGDVEAGQVGGSATAEMRHGSLALESVGGDLRGDLKHGNAKVTSVGGGIEMATAHGNLTASAVGGALSVKIQHGRLDAAAVGGDLTVEAQHSRVDAKAVGGSVRMTNRHGSLAVQNAGQDLLVDAQHTPVKVERVDGKVTVRTNHGSVEILSAGRDVSVEGRMGSVRILKAAGRVAVKNQGGSTVIEDAAGGVVVQAERGSVTIRSEGPTMQDCTVQSQRGTVDIAIPEGSAVDVRGYVRHGQVRTDLPLTVEGNAQSGQVVTGQLDGGGARVAVDVEGAELRLHR